MHSIAALALLLAAAAPADQTRGRDAAERAADPADKVICKRFTKTGSLVDSTRVCKTKADWQRERDNLRTSTNSTACQPGATVGC